MRTVSGWCGVCICASSSRRLPSSGLVVAKRPGAITDEWSDISSRSTTTRTADRPRPDDATAPGGRSAAGHLDLDHLLIRRDSCSPQYLSVQASPCDRGLARHTAELGSFSYGLPIRRQLLLTSPRGDAVALATCAVTSHDKDLHRADKASSQAHDCLSPLRGVR